MTFNIALARKIATGVAVAALGLVAFDLAPAAAAPPSWAPANGYRGRHDDGDWNRRDSRDSRDSRWGNNDRYNDRCDDDRYGNSRYDNGRYDNGRYDNSRYGSSRYGSSYGSSSRRGSRWDIDGDGRRNDRDYDRDGDGVPNSRDHHPDDPRRR